MNRLKVKKGFNADSITITLRKHGYVASLEITGSLIEIVTNATPMQAYLSYGHSNWIDNEVTPTTPGYENTIESDLAKVRSNELEP